MAHSCAQSLGILKAIIPPTHAAETRGSGHIAQYAQECVHLARKFEQP